MRIQTMRLRMQWYDLTVKYRKEKDMELPDTVSRAQMTHNTPDLEQLECISMLNYVAVSKEKCAELQEHTKTELLTTHHQVRLAGAQERCPNYCSTILGLKKPTDHV